MRVIVGVADMQISASPEDELITHALGSCLGITAYDVRMGVGGLLHVMLPESRIDPGKAQANPYMFVDTGVPELFRACYRLGARKEHIVLRVAGGACTHGAAEDDLFPIGARNMTMLRKLLWRNGVMIDAHDVGGCESRTMTLNLRDGSVTLRTNGQHKPLGAPLRVPVEQGD